MRKGIEYARDEERMEEIQTVAGVAQRDEEWRGEKRSPPGLLRGAVNDGGEGGRKKTGGKNRVGNFVREENDASETEQTAEDQGRRRFYFFATSKKETASEHAHHKFGQPHHGIEAENVFPEERDFAGIDFVRAIGMERDVSKREGKADEPDTDQTEKQVALRKLFAAKEKERKQEIAESFDAETPADRVPGESRVRNPRLQECQRKHTSQDEMLFAPGKNWQVEVANGKKEKWRGDDQRKDVSRVNARETRPPKSTNIETGAVVGVDKNESGEDKEKIYADEADACEILVPPRAARQDSYDAHVEQDDVQGRKKTQGSKRVEAWPHKVSC